MSSRTMLRTLEAVTLALSAFFVIATFLLVSTSSASEANPILDGLIGTVDWRVLAIAKLALVVVAFYVFRHAVELDERLEFWGVLIRTRDFGLAGAIALFLLTFANAVNDAFVLVTNFPDSYFAHELFAFSGLVVAISFILFLFPAASRGNLKRLKPDEKTLAVFLTFCMIVSGSFTVVALPQDESDASKEVNPALINANETAPAEEIITTSDYAGNVTGIYANNGTRAWQKNITGSDRAFDVSNSKNRTFVKDESGTVYSVYKSNGSVEWSTETTANTIGSIFYQSNSSRLFMGGAGGVYELDPQDGTVLQSNSPTTGRVRDLHVSPDGKDVYAATSQGGTYRMAASDLSVLWNQGGEAFEVEANNTHVWGGNDQDGIHRYYKINGTIKWTISSSNIYSMTSVDGEIYFANKETTVYIHDGETGNSIAQTSNPNGGFESMTVDKNGYVYGAGADEVYRVNPTNASLELIEGNIGHSSIWGIAGLGHNYPVTGNTATSDNNVSGVVRDQNGAPVSNATVEVTGVDYNEISTDGGQSLRDRADELLTKAEDVQPDSWDPNLNVDGSNSVFAEQNAKYPAMHYHEDRPVIHSTGPELDNPRVEVPANEEIVVTSWDPSSGTVIQDGWDEDMPGTSTDDTVVIKQLGAGGEVINTQSVSMSIDYESDALNLGSDHQYGTVTLAPGFYQISVKGSAFSYTAVAGDPGEITASIEADLRDRAGALTNRSKEISDNINTGKFTSATVQTNATGHFSVSVGSSVNVTSVQAYKAPYGLDPAATTTADIRELYDAQVVTNETDLATGESELLFEYETTPSSIANTTSAFDPSAPLPAAYVSAPKRVDAPNSNVTITAEKLETPSYADSQTVSNVSGWQEQFREEATNAETAANDVINRATGAAPNEADLDNIRQELNNTTSKNEALQSRIDELKTELNNSEANLTETEEELLAMKQAVAELENTTDTLRERANRSETGETDEETLRDRVLCQFGVDSACAPDDQTGVADGRWERSTTWGYDWEPPTIIEKDSPAVASQMDVLTDGDQTSTEIVIGLATEDGLDQIGNITVTDAPASAWRTKDFQYNTDAHPVNVSKGKYDLYVLAKENGTYKRLSDAPTPVAVSVEQSNATLVISNPEESTSEDEMEDAVNESDGDQVGFFDGDGDSSVVDIPDVIGGSGSDSTDGSNTTFEQNETSIIVKKTLDNGTVVTEVLNKSEYTVTTESGNTVIQIPDAQTANGDTSNENVTELVYELIAANEQQVVEETITVDGPASTNTAIDVKSVNSNSLRPTPGSNWDATVQYSTNDGYEIVNLSVYGPTGSALADNQTTVLSSDSIRVQPDSQGVHTVRLKFQNAENQTKYRTISVNARPNAYGDVPTLRASSIGGDEPVPVVGEGLEGGDIEISETQDKITVAVVLAADQTPGEVQINARELPDATEQEMTIRILRETPSGTEQVDRSVKLTIVDQPIPDGATIYRSDADGESPIQSGLSSGDIQHVTGKTTISTYTGQNGEVKIAVDTAPGLRERVSWFVATEIRPRVPSLGILGVVVPGGALASGLPVLFFRRRRQGGDA